MKIFDPLYTAVSWVILKLHDGFRSMGMSQSWAWSLGIVGLVMLIRIALIPLFVKQIRSMRNMQVLQPEIKKIQERYKGDRERISQELMKLYKEHNTNPLASCLPVLAQSPFFLSLYRVLSKISGGHPIGVIKGANVESAKNATFLGAHLSDKFIGAHSISVQIVTVVMIVAMCGSQFYTQRQLMTKNMPKDTGGTPGAFMQQQKIMMYLFPIMFAVFGINFPVGVLIYWLVSNFWSMGQQLYVIRRMPAVGSVAHDAMLRRKAGGPVEEGKSDGGGRPGGGLFAKRPQNPSAAPTGNGAAAPSEPDGAPAAKPVRQQPQRQPRSQRGGGGKKR